MRELSQARERETATAEVLRVISSSPGDLQPVFDAILEKAHSLCGAAQGTMFLCDGDYFRAVAQRGMPDALAGRFRQGVHGRGVPVTSPLIAGEPFVHIADLAKVDNPVTRAAAQLAGTRTLLSVPLPKEDALLGMIVAARREVRPFSANEIALLQNFAAQAVIAIENTRLLNDLRQRTTDLAEALEQQTATSEVLEVISSSPSTLEPVFTTMLEKAVRVCDAKLGGLYLYRDGRLRTVAAHDEPEFFEARRNVDWVAPPGGVIDEAIRRKQAVQVADMAKTRPYIERHPTTVEAVELGGIRTAMVVPMLKEDELVGVIAIHRREVLPFTDRQIELVKNFAAQAVIAIENTRLLNELRRSLERQTATADILRVISQSPTDARPVFDSIVATAVRLLGSDQVAVMLRDGDVFSAVAAATPEGPVADAHLAKNVPINASANFPSRAILDRQLLHLPDWSLIDLPEFELNRQRRFGIKAALYLPLLRDGECIGLLTLAGKRSNMFGPAEIAQAESFRDQALIAIENTRLFTELRERTDQLQVQSQETARLNQELEQRVADQVGEIERMGRLRRFLPPQVADLIVASGSEKQLESHRREITALFCDLRGFTGFSESADPEDVMALLRDYHAAIGEIIIKYSGTLERYAGDGVMVVFNDPVPVENPALQAVLMALEMRGAIGALTDRWRRLGHDIGFGIGIAHGFATLGTIGFEGRFDYAAIGTVSNVASRLCDEAKPGQILISPRVLMAVENAVKVEPVGEFELKGIRRPLAAYNVLATNREN